MSVNGKYKRIDRLEKAVTDQREARFDLQMQRIFAEFETAEVGAFISAVELDIKAGPDADFSADQLAALDKFDRLGGWSIVYRWLEDGNYLDDDVMDQLSKNS